MANDKPITNEELAQMVAKGFEHSATKDDVANMATKDDVAQLDGRLNNVENRLDRIENMLVRALENRIERLEDDMRQVKTTLEK